MSLYDGLKPATPQNAAGRMTDPAVWGVAGFKPSYKLIPTAGVKAFAYTLDTVGLFAASIADVAFAAAAITGRDLRVDAASPAAPRIALLRSRISSEASADMQAALEEAARAAAAAGAKVEPLILPAILEDAWTAQPTVQDYEASRALAFEYDNFADRLGPKLHELLERGGKIGADAYDAARRTTKQARAALADIFTRFDAILTPSAPGVAPETLASTGLPIFNRLWTLMGTPAVNVPGLADASGLPLGVQIVGRFGRDRLTLEVARFVEAAISRRG